MGYPKICDLTPKEYQDSIIDLGDLSNPKKEVLIFLAGLVEEVGELIELVSDNIEFNLEDPLQVDLCDHIQEFVNLAKFFSIHKRIFRGDVFPNNSQVLSIPLLSEKTQLKITKESGDVQAYKTLLDYCFGINLEDVLKVNKSKLEARREKGTLKGKGDTR